MALKITFYKDLFVLITFFFIPLKSPRVFYGVCVYDYDK